jgi:hypothetical protein
MEKAMSLAGYHRELDYINSLPPSRGTLIFERMLEEERQFGSNNGLIPRFARWIRRKYRRGKVLSKPSGTPRGDSRG